MGSQPEGKVSLRIRKEWEKRGGWTFKVHGSEFQPSGIPDICGVYKGISVWCETKMPGNTTSQIQKYRINKIRSAGAFVVVAYSVKEAVQMLEHIDTSDCTHALNECLYKQLFDLTETA